MANVGKVDVVLGVDSKQLTQGVQQATKTVQQFGKSLVTAGNTGASGVNQATKAVKQLDDVARKASASAEQIAGKMSSIGKQMTMKVTAPLVATGYAAIKTFNTFDYSMRKIVGLVGVNANVVAGWTDRVRDLGIEYGISGGKTAEALFYITSAGLRGEVAMSVLEQSLKASALGLGDVSAIADLSTSALNAYGAKNLSAADATDVMVATIREGKLASEELAGTMGRVLPLAVQMGVKFNDVGAAFAALSRVGFDASESATAVRQILAGLISPSVQAEQAMEGLGTSSSALRKIIREEGLLAGLTELADRFGTNETAAAAVFGNIRALSGVLSLIGPNAETTANIFAAMADNVGDTDKAFAAQAGGGAHEMAVASAMLKDAFLSLGAVLVPIIVPAFKAVMGIIDKTAKMFQSLPSSVSTIIVLLLGLATAVGPVLIGLAAMVKAWIALKAAMAGQAFTSMTAQFASAGPVIAGVAIAVLAVVAAYSMFSANAVAAKERQEALTESLRVAGEPTVVLTDKIGSLIAEYVALKTAAEGAATGVETEITGAQAFVASQVALEGLTQVVADAGLSIETITAAVQGGTNVFGDYANAIDSAADHADSSGMVYHDIIEVLDEYGVTGNAVADALMNQYRAGKINDSQLIGSLETLNNAATAFDDNREALNKQNEAYIKGADGIGYFSSVLGFDAFNAIVKAGEAAAITAGRTDEYTVAVELLMAEVDKTAIANAELAVAEELVAEATVRALPPIAQMNELLGMAKASGEEGAATFLSMATSLGILAAVLANQLVLVLAKADNNTAKLGKTFAGLKGNSQAIEQVIREQSMAMVQLLVDTTNAGGSITDALPSLKHLYDALINGAKAAGMDSDAVVGLIKKIGILDGLAPEVRLLLDLDASQLEAKIKAITDTLSSYRGHSTGFVQGLRDELQGLEAMLAAINFTPDSSGSGSSGSSSEPKPKNDFSWVEGYVENLAEYANSLISKDFARDLGTQTAEQINETLVSLLDKMKDLKLNKLPFFDAFRKKFKDDFKELAVLAKERDELVKNLDIARNGTVDKYSGVTLTKGLDELAKALEDVKSRSKDFAKSIAEGIMQPIGKGNALTGATNTLTKAKEFFKNITSLRTAGFGPDVIKEVVSAGLVDGNKLAKRLLSMSTTDIAQFTKVRAEINDIAKATGSLASDIVFATEIKFASDAFDAQKLIVQGLETSLATTNGEIKSLITTIQTDLYNTFFEFLSGFQGGIDQLNTFKPLPDSSTTTPGAGGTTTPGAGGTTTPDTGGTTPGGGSKPDSIFGSPKADANFTAWLTAQANKLIPGKSYPKWNIGPLPNGGAILGKKHIYLPPGLDFSGFHADGGIAMKASLGVIGESGPEAIIPLSKMSQFGSGDTYVTINVSGNVSSERDLVEAVRVGLLKAQRSNRTLVV